MSDSKIKEVVTLKTHPFESHFDIPQGSTEIVRKEVVSEEVDTVIYDEKDASIDNNFKEVYDKSLSHFQALSELAEDSEPRFVARISEVAATFLNTALSAANSKAKLKSEKDKLVVANKKIHSSSGDGGMVNLTMTTTDLADMLRKANELARDEKIINSIEPDKGE